MERKTWRSAGVTPAFIAILVVTGILILVLWFLWFYPSKPVRTHPAQPSSQLSAPLHYRNV